MKLLNPGIDLYNTVVASRRRWTYRPSDDELVVCVTIEDQLCIAYTRGRFSWLVGLDQFEQELFDVDRLFKAEVQRIADFVSKHGSVDKCARVHFPWPLDLELTDWKWRPDEVDSVFGTSLRPVLRCIDTLRNAEGMSTIEAAIATLAAVLMKREDDFPLPF